jgi:hypothetical protein
MASFKSIYGNYNTLKEEMVKTILGLSGEIPVFGTSGTIDSVLTKAVVGDTYDTTTSVNTLATVAWVDSKISSMGSGTVGGSGTAGRIAKFSSGTAIGNSIMTETNTTISVAGSLTATGTITSSGLITGVGISTSANMNITGHIVFASGAERQIRWSGSSSDGWGIYGNSTTIGIYNWTDGLSVLTVAKDTRAVEMFGNLTVNGNITATGEISAYSDSRLKTDVKSIESALDKVMQLNGVSYTRTDMDAGTQLGFIAQELYKIVPEVVNAPQTEAEFYSVKYNGMIALLVEAIKELNDKINNK